MATPSQMIDKWHWNILPAATKKALLLLSEQSWIARTKWYLAGGTALALHSGHRQSVDLDFFLPRNHFSEARIVGRFSSKIWKTTILREGTIYGVLCGAKVSFIAYPFFKPLKPQHRIGHVSLLDPADVAVMKVIAISQRGKKRDFLDLYWYCKHQESLGDVVWRVYRQYPNTDHNIHHIIKSLTYFDEAEDDP
ncbi:MAG: nucleotidyl transferase AbiEii/AbiGii toxin family protein, partial [bacterium]|nr:nucleotidyl transferase AbiEii/AbiGii toxin family protein [bacterium]